MNLLSDFAARVGEQKSWLPDSVSALFLSLRELRDEAV
jgi:hypothetical protein